MFICRGIKISTLHTSVGELCIRTSTTEARNIGRILISWNSICSNPCFAKYSSMKLPHWWVSWVACSPPVRKIRGFEPRSSQSKDYIIDMCCFSAKHAALWEKNKYLLDRNQDNVSEWGDMTIRELLIQ
jgi:hypothetical protein